MNQLPVMFRQANEHDHPFILSSWVRCERNTDLHRFVTNEVYYSKQGQLVEYLLSRSKVTVACDPEDDTHLYGYIVFLDHSPGTPVIHYMYVKSDFRMLGLGRELLNRTIAGFGETVITVTHIDKPEYDEVTKKKKSFFVSKMKEYKFSYDPFLVLQHS